jgi:hypothetical protein
MLNRGHITGLGDGTAEQALTVGSSEYIRSISDRFRPYNSLNMNPLEAFHTLMAYYTPGVENITLLVEQFKEGLDIAERMLAELKTTKVDIKERFMDNLPIIALDPKVLMPGAKDEVLALAKMGATYLLGK